VQSSMVYPFSKYQIIKQQYLNDDMSKGNIVKSRDQPIVTKV